MTNKEGAAPAALDRSDARVRHEDGMVDAFWSFVDRVRSGDLGMLPVVIGLVLISIVFSSLNPVFLAPNNLVNLLFDCATVGVISLGIVCVLTLGEIDLSVGSMSGFASALVGVLWVNSGWPVVGAILVAIAAGMTVGFLYAFLYNRLGMPSFIASLSGLLAILGMQLYILGPTGSINLPYASPLVTFGQILIMPAWLSHTLALVPGLVLVVTGLITMRHRRAAGLTAAPMTVLIVKAAALTALLEFGVYYLDLGRGVPWMFGFFVLLAVVLNYALTRTKWGRSMFAVGGNREAARRSGINVRRIYTSAFVLCSTFAAIGGILSASRLATSSQQAGTGDVNLNAIAAAVIGGTSLFGGRGRPVNALLGALVIASVANGMDLLGLAAGTKFIVTGLVLLAAVLVDSISKKGRASAGLV